MSAPDQNKSAQGISLETAKVLHIDCEAGSRVHLNETLGDIGFQHVLAAENVSDFADKLESEAPDLVFIDIDTDSEWAFQSIRAMRNGELGGSQFVVIVALTQKPELAVVQAALAAGCDDMVVKPVTPRALRERVVNQIENRQDFIATDDYIGPDRRADTRELTEDDPDAIEVPNSLRYAATGDEAAAPSEDRIKETLRNLSMQKFYCLSQKVGRIAEEQRDLLLDGGKSGDVQAAVNEIAEALEEIDGIIGEQSFQSVTQVVASTRQALDSIQAQGNDVTARHFDLLQAHGGSIGVVLKESDESAGVLVSALEKAVAVVKGETDEVEKAAGVDGSEAPADAADSDRALAAAPSPAPPPVANMAEPAHDGKIGRISFMVRFKAWWHGVDPQDILAGAGK